ncbi:MAG: hypothetical protein ACI4GA_00600 [Acutalibacteraceae bacterium]|nr:hypothetical protein [Oscillospiraceae bacterium]
MQTTFRKYIIIFGIGAITYSLIEVLVRQYTHWTMTLTGGAVFCTLYYINTHMKSRNLLLRCLIGSAVITAYEFAVGLVVNYFLHMGVWDYSNQFMNVLGQICLKFSVLWFLLCIPVTGLIYLLRNKLDRIIV